MLSFLRPFSKSFTTKGPRTRSFNNIKKSFYCSKLPSSYLLATKLTFSTKSTIPSRQFSTKSNKPDGAKKKPNEPPKDQKSLMSFFFAKNPGFLISFQNILNQNQFERLKNGDLEVLNELSEEAKKSLAEQEDGLDFQNLGNSFDRLLRSFTDTNSAIPPTSEAISQTVSEYQEIFDSSEFETPEHQEAYQGVQKMIKKIETETEPVSPESITQSDLEVEEWPAIWHFIQTSPNMVRRALLDDMLHKVREDLPLQPGEEPIDRVFGKVLIDLLTPESYTRESDEIEQNFSTQVAQDEDLEEEDEDVEEIDVDEDLNEEDVDEEDLGEETDDIDEPTVKSEPVRVSKDTRAKDLLTRKDPIPRQKTDTLDFELNDIPEILDAPDDILPRTRLPAAVNTESEESFDAFWTKERIGHYFLMPDREYKTYLPEGVAFELRKEFRNTKLNAIMMRDLAFDLTRYFNRCRSSGFRKSMTHPILIGGHKGIGKSALISSLVYWARKSGWIAVYLKGYEVVNEGYFIEKSRILRNPDCWDQPVYMMKWMAGMLEAHQHQFKTIPLRTDFNMGPFEGKTLFDLVEFASVEPRIAGEACVYLRNELAVQTEYPVLVAVDDYNCLYFPSMNFRDPESTRHNKANLEGRRFTLGSLYYDSHVKGPGLSYGMFVGALTRKIPSWRDFVVPNPSWKYYECPPYNRLEIEHALDHLWASGFLENYPGKLSRDYIYQLTNGFGKDIYNYVQPF